MFFELFWTFFKLGALTFGGGYAMIPILTDEVLAHGWLTAEEILNFIAVAESTPGPIAINMATFIGASQGGVPGTIGSLFGALCATFGVILPSFIIILLIASLITGLMRFAGVKAFLNGVRPVVVGLIIGTAITIFITVMFSIDTVYMPFNFDWRAISIFGAVAIFNFVLKKCTKKAVSLIILIMFSAILGVLFYGLI